MRASDVTRLLILAALWGGSFLLYRIVAPVLGTVLSVEARVGIAAVVLVAWQASVKPAFAWRGHVGPMLVVGIFNSAVPFAAFGFAAHALPAAYLAVINATSPLFGAVVARIWFGDPLDARRMVGIVAGLIGVVALVGLGPVDIRASTLLACGACLLAAASYGFAGNYTKRLPRPVPPTDMATGSQIAAAIVMLPLIPLEPLAAMPSAYVLGATLILAVACTSIAYLLYFRLIKDLGATRALSVTFLIPLFAIAWAWFVLGEAPTPRMAIGAALVIVATWLIVAKRPAAT